MKRKNIKLYDEHKDIQIEIEESTIKYMINGSICDKKKYDNAIGKGTMVIVGDNLFCNKVVKSTAFVVVDSVEAVDLP